MEPNLTILVQAFNFFLVYLLLKYLLFKPAVQYLKNEEREKKYIEDGISEQQNLLEQKIETKNQTWKKYQGYFKKHNPETRPTFFTLEEMEKEPEILELSQDDIDRFSEKMQKALIERVGRVRQ